MNLIEHLQKQHEFSQKTFGPGYRTDTVIAHIRKELIEVESSPQDIEEWIDIVLLAFDGALRSGNTPEQISQALAAKLKKNMSRTWKDWKQVKDGEVIEHIRS